MLFMISSVVVEPGVVCAVEVLPPRSLDWLGVVEPMRIQPHGARSLVCGRRVHVVSPQDGGPLAFRHK